MQDIKSLLPHREPFLYVDRLEKADAAGTVGYRKFLPGEYFFKGHFPAYPVVPGVILLESMMQCGGAGVASAGLLGDALFFFASADKVKMRRQVRPNDEVRLVVTNVKVSKMAIKQAGRAYVGDELAAEAEWLCMVSPRDKLK